MEERGLLTRKRRKLEESEENKKRRKESFDGLDMSVGELVKSEKIII